MSSGQGRRNDGDATSPRTILDILFDIDFFSLDALKKVDS